MGGKLEHLADAPSCLHVARRSYPPAQPCALPLPIPLALLPRCGGDEVGREFGAAGPIPQRFSACPDPPAGPDRARWGLHAGQGRGAPEIDLLEVK